MRVLGIDYGDSHIGLAVSDKLLLTAQALDNYRSKNKEEDKKGSRRYLKFLSFFGTSD
jgi:RNase H-fold protein (predicted Holliday junction resolvase)